MLNVQSVSIAVAPKIAIFGNFLQIPHFCHFGGNLGFWCFPGILSFSHFQKIPIFWHFVIFGELGKLTILGN